MEERKRNISFGLPGRLSINGFNDYDFEGGFLRFRMICLGVSAIILAAATLIFLIRPQFAQPLTSWPLWIWPAVGIALTVPSAVGRGRFSMLLLLVLWAAFAMRFVAPLPDLLSPDDPKTSAAAGPPR